jgi:uncharacterized protein YbjQ (UPF0145 family)
VSGAAPVPLDSKPPVDLRALMRRASNSKPGVADPSARSLTSDLSIDEELALHAVGYEPVELVCGTSIHSVPFGVWNWGAGEIHYASDAYARSFAAAIKRIHEECVKAGGHGVVGVEIERRVTSHHITVELTGTAIRPVGAGRIHADDVFVSDLSGRDFSLLSTAGWMPLGLASGASYVYAPRRTAGAVLKQTSQNVELTNFTEAMYAARETAMERMQAQALAMKGTGVVDVKVVEGPLPFAKHAIGFSAYGTVVHLVADQHRSMAPLLVLPLDDATVSFEARNLG